MKITHSYLSYIYIYIYQGGPTLNISVLLNLLLAPVPETGAETTAALSYGYLGIVDVLSQLGEPAPGGN